MAYDFIPQTVNDIKKAGVFGAEYESVYTYLSEKYNRNPNEVAGLVVVSTFFSIFYIPIILSFLI